MSGIGPTLAVKILSGLAAPDLIHSIRRGEVERLVRIPGIGKKTAERMVLELRDKLPAAAGEEPRDSGGRGAVADRSGRALRAAESGLRAAAGRGRGAQSQGRAAAAPRSSSRSSAGRWNWYGKLVAHARPGTGFRRPPGRRCCSSKPACARAGWPISPARPS